jgi:TonB family protein
MLKWILPLLLLCAAQEGSTLCVLHTESLEYPRLAWQARIEGEVRVRVHVGADGKVASAVSNSGHKLLRQAAEENVRKWIFSPKCERDIEVLYQFRLEAPEVDLRPVTRVTFDLPDRVLVVANLPRINS